MSESRSLFGARYKHLTRFSTDSYRLNPQLVLCKRLTLSTASIFVTEGLIVYTFISCYLKKIIKIGFPELEKKFSNDFALFGLRIEHLCHIIPKAHSWLVLNLPVFMFVYIHFNVPPTR